MISAAFDNSAGAALAIACDDKLLLSTFLASSGRESDRLLAPWLLDCFNSLQLELSVVERWTLGTGPGSFAGLRCGIALAKGICAGQPKTRRRGVPSSFALACELPDPVTGEIFGVLHDGRCGQLLLSSFRWEDTAPVLLAAPVALFPEELLHESQHCQRWLSSQAASLPALPEAVKSQLYELKHLNASHLLTALNWDWPESMLEQDQSCEPLYIRPAVFVPPITPRSSSC